MSRTLALLGVMLLASCLRSGFPSSAKVVREGGADLRSLDQAAADLALDQHLPFADHAVLDLLADRPRPDRSPPDRSPPDLFACPPGMLRIGTTAICIDQNESPPTTWVLADQNCKKTGKRLCHEGEWVAACKQTPAPSSMTGNWEWLVDLYSTTSAKKRGAVTCDSASSHDINSGDYYPRCCK